MGHWCRHRRGNFKMLSTFPGNNGCRIVFVVFCLRFWIFFGFSFPVPFALYLAMFAFHFAWYLSHFGISTSHLHGICYILVLQTFMWVSWGFFKLSLRVSVKVSFGVSFRVLFRASSWVSFRVSFRISLRFHLGSLPGSGFFRVSFRVFYRFSLIRISYQEF